MRGLILVISISCVLIALTLSVFYYTVSTLARGVDRSYKKINNLFHSLRMQAEEHQSNTKNEPGDRLAKTFDGQFHFHAYSMWQVFKVMLSCLFFCNNRYIHYT